MADPKPIPYASADPVADLLADEYGMDYEQAVEMSRRIKSKQLPDTYNATGEAMDKTGKNEIKRMDTLVTNAKRYADIKARKEAGAELGPDEQDFYTRVRGAAMQKMAAEGGRSPATEQRVNSIRHLGFGPGGKPQDPNDGAYQAMDAMNNGDSRARQLQTESQAFRTAGPNKIPLGQGAEGAETGMFYGAAGGVEAAGPPPASFSGAAAGNYSPVGMGGGEANYEEPPRYMGGGTGAPAPQLDIGALLRKRWEEEQLRALLASGVPQ